MFIFVLILNTCTCFDSLTIVMEILFNYIFDFGIKICPKLPIFLTIQKSNFVNRLSVASFASSIKPPPFTGSNYMRWHERAILWFTVMHVVRVTEGKPSQYTLEEESAFETSNNLFRGCLISVLAEILWTHISVSRLAIKCGMLLRFNMQFLMPAVSCTSWSSF